MDSNVVAFEKLVIVTADVIEIAESANTATDETLKTKIISHLCHVVRTHLEPLQRLCGVDKAPANEAYKLLMARDAERFAGIDAKRKKRGHEALIRQQILADL